MNALRTTPIDRWTRRLIGLEPNAGFIRENVRRRQLELLRETVSYAGRKSPFYRRRFSGRPGLDQMDWDRFASLPLTTPKDLRRDPLEFLCVSQAEVARAVTLRSSGTTAPPKRLFFSAADLERTVDFFRAGMSTLVDAGQRVLILLPGGSPGSIGDLLVTGLSRLGASGVVYGPVRDPSQAIDAVLSERPSCLVGNPVQVLSLARHPKGALIPRGCIRSALLSTDYVPASLVDAIERVWGCHVYQHYGMTEMGYGGGVECDAHQGYHLRDADLLVEIVDPVTGQTLPDGVSGEVVFTTLSRRAMPLIRYRTGDIARFMPDYCPCGSILRRLGKVQGRLTNGAALGPSKWLSMAALDEAIFAVPDVIDFKAVLIPADGFNRLSLTVYIDLTRFMDTVSHVRATVEGIEAVRDALDAGVLRIDPVLASPAHRIKTGSTKRTLIDQRQEGKSP